MSPLDLREHFTRFREGAGDVVHFAAHSHHYWPDAACEAQIRALDDATRLADRKWAIVFGEIVPAMQRGVAERLSLPDPDTIALAPNTHEFVRRLLSCFPAGKRLRVLTSDSEFHSFGRQAARMEEEGLLDVTRVPAEPFESFAERFATAAHAGYDMAFVSHVFYNSGGVAGDLDALVDAAAPHAEMIVIDGYHGFMALPTDLSRVASRAFYTAGGYKYAMAGEGACFLHCPPGAAARPRDTGWFAAFGALGDRQDGVPYAPGGARFLGATFDPVGLYRQAATFAWMDGIGLTVEAIHAHAAGLQRLFLDEAAEARLPFLTRDRLITRADAGAQCGHFLTYRFPQASLVREALMSAGIVTDVRDDCLRVGFGCYHVAGDVRDGVRRMARTLAEHAPADDRRGETVAHAAE